MILSPQVQTLVDQLVQVMGLQAFRPSAIEINMDGEGIVQDVKPKLTYKRAKEKQAQVRPQIHVVLLTDGRYVNAVSGQEAESASLSDPKFTIINPGRPVTWVEHCKAHVVPIRA